MAQISKESIELSEQLIQMALKGEHPDPPLIRSVKEYLLISGLKDNIIDIVNNFKHTKKKLDKEYLQHAKQDTVSLDFMVAYKQLLICIDYYSTEIKIISRLLTEYYVYIKKTKQIISSIFMGRIRPEADLVNFLEK